MAAALALLSSVLWGAGDFGGGLASRRRAAVAVTGWSQACALVAIGCVVPFTGGLGGPGGWIGWAAAAGCLGSAALVAFYTALAIGTMGVVSPIAALGAVVPVLSGLLSGDSPSRWQLLGIGLGLAGVVAASGPELGRGGRAGPAAGLPEPDGTPGAGRRSVLLAALAGAGFGGVLVCVQRGALVDPVHTLFGMRVTSVAIFVVVARRARRAGGVRPREVPGLAAVGLSDIGGNLLFALAGRQGMVSVVGVLGALYPVTTVLLGRLVLGERLQRLQWAGVLVALGGVVLLATG